MMETPLLSATTSGGELRYLHNAGAPPVRGGNLLWRKTGKQTQGMCRRQHILLVTPRHDMISGMFAHLSRLAKTVAVRLVTKPSQQRCKGGRETHWHDSDNSKFN